VWTRNAASDTQRKIPDWGLSSSPLVVGDLVLIAVSGTLVAYDRATGALRWSGPAAGGSYSSPHLLVIDGVPQVLLMSGDGAASFAPTDGKVLWQHEWKGFAIVQPAQIADGEFLISTGDRSGARRIKITHKTDSWTAEELWTTTRLKAYFNDFILFRGHAYGFDGGILACVDLADGERKWKGGRYGAGQVLLLADQDLLLVLSEQGELALVAAKRDAFAELARFPAVRGKTWNHPVLAGDILLVRNDQEMAAFRLR
jgi:outer membrane protein assembly factor BamB